MNIWYQTKLFLIGDTKVCPMFLDRQTFVQNTWLIYQVLHIVFMLL